MMLNCFRTCSLIILLSSTTYGMGGLLGAACRQVVNGVFVKGGALVGAPLCLDSVGQVIETGGPPTLPGTPHEWVCLLDPSGGFYEYFVTLDEAKRATVDLRTAEAKTERIRCEVPPDVLVCRSIAGVTGSIWDWLNDIRQNKGNQAAIDHAGAGIVNLIESLGDSRVDLRCFTKAELQVLLGVVGAYGSPALYEHVTRFIDPNTFTPTVPMQPDCNICEEVNGHGPVF